MSAGVPRDRRGWIAQTQNDRRNPWHAPHDEDEDNFGGETPKMGGTGGVGDRGREREFLDSLKSVFLPSFPLFNFARC